MRKKLDHFRVHNPSHYIILAGDQLYRMDLEEYMRAHTESRAEITIAATPVTRTDSGSKGILCTDSQNRVRDFMEKPGPEQDMNPFRMPQSTLTARDQDTERFYLASMGIYIFNASVMEESLQSGQADFGKEIIPQAISQRKVMSYIYRGYWEDIGTIRSFYQANLELGAPYPRFNLYDQSSPLYTHRRDLPPTKINSSTLKDSLASEGSIISDAVITRSLIGIRSVIEPGAVLEDVYTMGGDFYETEDEKADNAAKGVPNCGIGEGTRVRGAIIDKNVRIGRDCRIGLDQKEDGDYDGYAVRDGIIVIMKGTVIPDGTVI